MYDLPSTLIVFFEVLVSHSHLTSLSPLQAFDDLPEGYRNIWILQVRRPVLPVVDLNPLISLIFPKKVWVILI
jgi:hypothetical protein